ncbi:MAG: hypothetical protein KDA20_09590 [Phycisphaerales bacterium]|nr:hypothetical protein [Phycisphaerales bacterium]
MVSRRLCLAAGGIAFLAAGSNAQTVYSGYDVAFTKAGFANPSLPANQDAITAGVAITRGSTAGIYNAVVQASYSLGGPADTEWAFGTTANWSTLTYDVWVNTVASSPPSSVGQNMVVHLISEDIYLDIRFTAWGVGPSAGGSFSYVRSAIPAPGAIALLPIAGVCARRRRR